METVVLNGVLVAFEVSGIGEPVLLVGGTGMPPVGWDAMGLRPALIQAGYRVLIYAARGVAPSAGPPGPYRVTDLAGEAAGLLDHLGVRGCRVVGLSLGGFITEVLARTRPDLVRAAVLAASAGPTTALSRLMVRAQRDVAATGVLPASVTILDSVRGALAPEVLRDDDAEVERWAQMLAFDTWSGPDGRAGQYAAAWEWLDEDDTRMDLLAEITVPTLVIAFEHDLGFPPRCGRQAAAAMPRGEFVQIPDAAHAGAFTHSQPCRDAIVHFLQHC